MQAWIRRAVSSTTNSLCRSRLNCSGHSNPATDPKTRSRRGSSPCRRSKSSTYREGNYWRGFEPGDWRKSINVRDFIVRNASPYGGDESFLAGPSERTKAVWEKLQPYFQEEQKKGVLAVDAKTPSTLLAHQAGYIDRDNEVIVGLQTDQPFRRAIFPFGDCAWSRRTKGGRLRSRSPGARSVHEISQDSQ